MALPTSRAEFKEYCLRKLGKPVIEINVDDQQVEDRIDEALQFYFDYHMDGSSKVFYKHQITDTDKTNGYITIPNNFLSITRVLDVSDLWVGYGDAAMFSPQYQYALNTFSTIASESLIPYYMDMERAALYDFLLASANPLRYNRHENRLYIDTDWDKFSTNDYIVLEGYVELDTSNADIWKDKWLLAYATALIKQQWGQNLIKYEGMQLPGGVQLNGRQIFDDAKEEIERLREELRENYQLPPEDFIG